MKVYKPDKDLDQQFFNEIHGKDVVIVGPAAYLEGSGFGKNIDSKDVIVRINRSFETPEKIPEDVGSRTDIIYSCLLETHRNAGFLDFEKIRKAGVKMICAPGFKRVYASHPQGLYGSHPEIKDSTWKKMHAAKYKARIISEQLDSALKSATQTRPNTGFLAIFDILTHHPRTLSIHGFTFYLDGFIKGTKEGVEKEKNCTEEEFALLALRSKRHNQENMWKFAKENLPKAENVILDDTMKKILSLEKFSREEFLK
jgi:hypothetical protein